MMASAPILFAALLGSAVTGAGDTCSTASLLPAYSHNDYHNRRPLLDALALGFRGVEADVFRVGTELLVGHDRRELRASWTLSHVYLEPLRDRHRACGFVLPDASPFFLNVELKDADTTAFRYLLTELRQYEELFRVSGPSAGPPVRVTLVGWWPMADTTHWPDYLCVQLVVERRRLPAVPANQNVVGLVTIDYGKVLRWRGHGDVPSVDKQELAAARELAGRLAVPLRVHHAPVDSRVYRWLLSEGVTLIGSTDLRRSRALF
jgi:hypothetical protein